MFFHLTQEPNDYYKTLAAFSLNVAKVSRVFDTGKLTLYTWTQSRQTATLTCSVRVTVVVKTASGYRLAAKQRIAVQVVAKFFQEAEDIGDTADSWQGQGVLLLVKKGWKRHGGY